MAAIHYSPIPTEIEDPVTYKEASALLARTGHPYAAGSIARWDLPKVRVGKTFYVSWTDVQQEHFRRTAVKLRTSSNWP
ncbi:hypothetical protein [Streptomyces sp. AS02]|uniref:hypothetical protein n=1 Tax=Streptomyces sp. AS02 TaxID=2938946 RepID=UPI002020B2AB|nr:hypothetical protein [Streptomyces sp. AS02]MCL8016930.1 hypothetical protein [Streptomyces sp. AS02]